MAQGIASLRIAVLGPESSGKTTLCKQLYEATDALYVAEVARTYLEARPTYQYSLADLETIAKQQFEQNSIASDKHIVCDTEMSTLVIWAMDKFDTVPHSLLDLERSQVFDIYLLCAPDLPWEADPMREDEHRRDHIFELYRERLLALGRPFSIIAGDERLQTALSLIGGN